MNTEQLMQIALEMAELEAIPGDSAIYVPGNGIERILVGIDVRGEDPKDTIIDLIVHVVIFFAVVLILVATIKAVVNRRSITGVNSDQSAVTGDWNDIGEEVVVIE